MNTTNSIKYITYLVDSMSNEAHFTRTKAAESLARVTEQVSSFDLDGLITANAKQVVAATLNRVIDKHTGSDDELFATLERVAQSQALNSWKPNSTSNTHVEIELAIHFKWVEIAARFAEMREAV
jgi:hypothetical protein